MFGYSPGIGQITIKGKVFDETGLFSLESVSVLSSSNAATVTNKLGQFEIDVLNTDSIWFSYVGKETMKFPVEDILSNGEFTISIKIPVYTLPAATVKTSNYRLDSITNRMDYRKVFDYQNPSFRSIFKSISITGITIDIHELLRLFQFEEKMRMMNFKNRLITAERQKFINRKFNKWIIKEVVDIPESDIEAFVSIYSPDYFFAITATEYEMKSYIKQAYEKYRCR